MGIELKEVEGINEIGDLAIRGEVSPYLDFDYISLSRSGEVLTEINNFSGGDFEFMLNQNEDILILDSFSGILSPNNFVLNVSLEIGGSIPATVDLPVDISYQSTYGTDTYSQWYHSANITTRIFFPMSLTEDYVKTSFSGVINLGNLNYLYRSTFTSAMQPPGLGMGKARMIVGHRYYGPIDEYPMGMQTTSAFLPTNTQEAEAKTNKWVDENYMTDLSYGECQVNLTISNMSIFPDPLKNTTVRSPD